MADKRKDEFLATLAHELRGPLAPLSNVLELWKRSDEPPSTAQARETMERQLGQMVRLVDDLLDLNRITHDRLELRKTRVELGDRHRARGRSLPAVLTTRARLRVTLAGEPMPLRADPLGWRKCSPTC